MTLQLAENNLFQREIKVKSYKRKPFVKAHTRTLSDNAKNLNPYIFIPDFEAGAGGIFVREDKFDGLPADQYKLFMDLLAPYQPEHSQALDEEDEHTLSGIFKNWIAGREERKAKRTERKGQRVESKNKARETRANAKMTRAEAKKIKSENGGESFLDKIVGGAKDIFGKGQDGGATPGGAEPTPFYKNPLVLGGIGVVLVGGYFLTRKK